MVGMQVAHRWRTVGVRVCASAVATPNPRAKFEATTAGIGRDIHNTRLAVLAATRARPAGAKPTTMSVAPRIRTTTPLRTAREIQTESPGETGEASASRASDLRDPETPDTLALGRPQPVRHGL